MYRILPTVLVIKNKHNFLIMVPHWGTLLIFSPHPSLAPSLGWVLIYLLAELGGRSWAF